MSNYVKSLVNLQNLLYSYSKESDRVIYPSIDKLLILVDSKYKLVHVAAWRSKQINETGFLQEKEEDYISTKNIGRALEEIADNLIKVKNAD